MRRMLALRQFPMFAHAELGELVVVAENVVERTFAANEQVLPEHPQTLQLVVDGALATGPQRAYARDVVGALEVIANRAACAPTVALEPSRTLELDGSDYFEVLEDNFGLLLGTLRDLAARVKLVGARSELPYVDATRLGLVERMIVLRQQFPFEQARLEPLAILAHAATEARFPATSTIHAAATPVDALVVLEGTARIGDRILAPGDAHGFIEALAGTHHTDRVDAITSVRLLQTRAATLLDVLEDHTDLALAVARALARAVLARRDCTPVDGHAVFARNLLA